MRMMNKKKMNNKKRKKSYIAGTYEVICYLGSVFHFFRSICFMPLYRLNFLVRKDLTGVE